MKTAVIYAPVSPGKQREENTIGRQTAALIAFAGEQQFEVPREWVFEDDGYSGASLIRPGLERVRDLAAEGLIQAILVLKWVVGWGTGVTRDTMPEQPLVGSHSITPLAIASMPGGRSGTEPWQSSC